MSRVDLDIEHLSLEELRTRYFDLAFKYEEMTPSRTEPEFLALRHVLWDACDNGGLKKSTPSPSVARLISLLLSGNLYSATQIYGHISKADKNSVQSVNVFVCRARKILSEISVEIHTVFGQGYVMPVSSCERLNTLISQKMGRDILDVSARPTLPHGAAQ